jgi:hypothetical protein
MTGNYALADFPVLFVFMIRNTLRTIKMMSPTAARAARIGRTTANRLKTIAPTASPVAMTGFPNPPVRVVDMPRASIVDPCTSAALPPPAMTASVHFRRGFISVS